MSSMGQVVITGLQYNGPVKFSDRTWINACKIDLKQYEKRGHEGTIFVIYSDSNVRNFIRVIRKIKKI